MANIHPYIKYTNRRLYDPTKCGYVTLSDVRHAIESGEVVQVKHRKDGSDITREILLEVLILCEADRPHLSCDDLHRMIRPDTAQ